MPKPHEDMDAWARGDIFDACVCLLAIVAMVILAIFTA